MNIIFFTQEDPFYVKIFFDAFMENYEHKNDIKAVVISKPMGKKNKALMKQMYDFYGPKDFLKIGIKYVYKKIMGNIPVKIENNDKKKTHTVKQLMKSYRINVIERSDINKEDFIDEMIKLEPDLFISVASPIIFKERLISIPRYDCINIHNGLLPNYRGMLPNFWQLYNKEKYSGITIHKINKEIDKGDILLQRKTNIESINNLHKLIVMTKKEGAKYMAQIIEKYRNNEEIGAKIIEGKGSYYSFPKKSDVKKFKRNGNTLM